MLVQRIAPNFSKNRNSKKSVPISCICIISVLMVNGTQMTQIQLICTDLCRFVTGIRPSTHYYRCTANRAAFFSPAPAVTSRKYSPAERPSGS